MNQTESKQLAQKKKRSYCAIWLNILLLGFKIWIRIPIQREYHIACLDFKQFIKNDKINTISSLHKNFFATTTKHKLLQCVVWQDVWFLCVCAHDSYITGKTRSKDKCGTHRIARYIKEVNL